ncbi:MAG: hypothetical protein ACRC20_10960 [Segniliparus sp.]|uniref:hypothetical protein n=1 Tax=Segniliparus sp. TaxID=2804064 RepID=UPI003F3F6D73
MSEREPARAKQRKRRPRFGGARAGLLGALAFGSLIGGAAAASAEPEPSVPIIGGYNATCEYSSNTGTARPIVAAAEGAGDTEQQAIDNARASVPGNPRSVNCFLTDQDQPNVANAFNAARGQDSDDDDSATGGSYHQRHNNPGR